VLAEGASGLLVVFQPLSYPLLLPAGASGYGMAGGGGAGMGMGGAGGGAAGGYGGAAAGRYRPY
jgi:hypothetical protein